MSPRLGEEGHVPMARGRRIMFPWLGEEARVPTARGGGSRDN